MKNEKFYKNLSLAQSTGNAARKLPRPCSAPPVDKLFVSDDVELIDIQYSSYYSRNNKDDVRIPPPNVHIKGKFWLSEYDDIINKAFSCEAYNFKSISETLLDKIDNENPESKSSEFTGTSRTTTPIGDASVLDPNAFSSFLSYSESAKKIVSNLPYKSDFELSADNSFVKDIYMFYAEQKQKQSDPSVLPLSCLRDYCIYMSKDQEGSRLIQDRIDISTDDEISWFFAQIEDCFYDLSSNLFGNYVVQKILPKLNQTQKFLVYTEFRGRIYELSLHPYGCRVIQKLMECLESIECIIAEIKDNIFNLIEDQNGNHVIQKYIEKSENKEAIISVFKDYAVFLSTHRYGCRVIQRLLEFCVEDDVRKILEILIYNLDSLVNDQYGNYVIQHMLTVSTQSEKNQVIDTIAEDCYNLSKFKFSSNVIEQCIAISDDKQKDSFLAKFLVVQDSKPLIYHMCTDMYGNYVVQKFYNSCNSQVKEKIKKVLREHIKELKKVNFARHILYKINT